MARRTARRWVGIYLRGAAMGIAEVIPGVSGGTIAFITGIYRELLETIAGLSLRSLARLREGLVPFWRSTNLAFLLVLGAGMVTSVIVLAQVIRDLLAAWPLQVWGFFFGLILGSAVDIGRQAGRQALLRIAPAGLACGLLLAISGAAELDPSLLNLTLGGMIAVTAWILPGVSGGYMLLLLGLYPTVISAVADVDMARLAAVGAGCVVGLALFSRILAYLMRRHYSPVIGLLTGFMVGSLVKLWPWRVVESDAAGAATEWPVLPWIYADAVGDPMMFTTLVAMAVGVGTVSLLILARESRPAASQPD